MLSFLSRHHKDHNSHEEHTSYSPAALGECTVLLTLIRPSSEHSHCFHLWGFFAPRCQKFEHFKLKWRVNDLLVEFLAPWVMIVPVYITSNIRLWILKEKYHGHLPTNCSPRECCQVSFFWWKSMYLLPQFSIETESLEIEFFTLSGSKDYAGGSAMTCFHMYFCLCRRRRRLLLPSSTVSPGLCTEIGNPCILCIYVLPHFYHMLKNCFKTFFKLSMQHSYFSR